MNQTLSSWRRRLLGFPKRIDCPKMELIGRDHEGALIQGPGYIEILNSANIRFSIFGEAADFAKTVKKIQRTAEHPYEALEQFRLIATDYSGVEWNGGYTVVNFFADTDVGFPLKGELASLMTLDQRDSVDPESSVELLFHPAPTLPMTTERITMNRPLFAGGPEVRILGYGKDEQRNTLSRGTARASGADGFGSRERIREQIGGNIVDLSESWVQQGQLAHLGQAA